MSDDEFKAMGNALVAAVEKALYDQLVQEFGKEAVDRKMAERALRARRLN